jgi:hypothetical protein
MAIPKNPLIKELLQALARFMFKHFSQIVRLGIAIGKALQICSERSSEVLVSNVMAQHMEYTSTLFIGVPVKEVIRMLVHFCYNRPSISGSSLFKIIVSCLHHIILELIFASTCLPIERLAVSGKAFVEPDVLPISAGDKIAKPLVCQLMRYKIVTCKVKVSFFVMKCIQR